MADLDDGVGRGFVGWSLPVVVAGAAALSAGAALSVAVYLERTGVEIESALYEDVEARAAAGEAALAAVDAADEALEAARQRAWTARREAAEARATVLALWLDRGPIPPGFAPGAGEQVGWIDEMGRGWDRAGTATLAVALPALVGGSEDDEPRVVHTGRRVFALMPRRASDGRRAIASVAAPSRAPGPGDLAAARGRIGNLAEPPRPPPARRSAVLMFAAAAALGALAAGLWAAARVSRPLANTLEAARAFAHGDHRARAEPRGGAEARASARVVNALIEQAVRLQADGRAAREADIQAAAIAIEQFGQGDLRRPTPRLQAPFGPVSRALDGARKDLLRRIEGLHEQARVVAESACTLAPSARRLAAVTEAQRQALDRWGEGVVEAHRRVAEDAGRLTGAVEALDVVASEQRRATQDLKATLALVTRRLQDLSGASERVRGAVEAAQVLEQALGLLGVWAASAPPSQASRATQMVGEGQAALGRLGAELREMQGELDDLGETLSTLAEGRIDPPPSPASTVGGPLLDAGAGLVRAAELTQQGLGGFARSLRGLDQEAAQLTEGAARAAGRLDALEAALSELRVGHAFETVLLERLEAAKAALRPGQAGALSPDGQAMLAEVDAAAEATRGRLGRLIVATEATLDVLRHRSP